MQVGRCFIQRMSIESSSRESTDCFSGDPLHCWVPAQFTGNYETYTNRLCYIQNTYHIHKNQPVPQDAQIRRERTLKYYQWINFVLLFQALFFSLPKILWQSLNDKIGLSVSNLLDAANRYESFDGQNERSAIVKYISNYLIRYENYVHPDRGENISSFRRLFQQAVLLCQCRSGSSLVLFYCLIRIFYLINLILQMSFLQYFFSYHDVSFLHYGWTGLSSLLSGFTLPESRLFPRITLCDFKIRELGERHHYTVECILVINIFIEKLYFLFWIWLFFLLIVSIVQLMSFVYAVFVPHSRHRFIAHHLELIVRNRTSRDVQFRSFLRYFPTDNVFVLRLLDANSSMLLVSEVLDEVFRRKLEESSDV